VSESEGALTVHARVTYLRDRRMTVTIDGPNGPVESEPYERTGDTAGLSYALAREAFPNTEILCDIRSGMPPWLQEGQYVRVMTGAEAGDDDERPELAWIAGLVDGGIIVVGVMLSMGIYAPEEIDDTSEVTPEDVALIKAAQQRNEEADRLRP
jgi:hypothetical protein